MLGLLSYAKNYANRQKPYFNGKRLWTKEMQAN